MVRHHQQEREPRWQRSVVINGVGAVATVIVMLIIVAVTKFTEGAWIPIVVIPVDRAAVQGDQAPLRRRSPTGSQVDAGLQAAPHEPHRRRARRQRAPRRARGARVREVAAPEPPGRGDGRLRRGGAGAHRAGSGRERDIDVPLEIVHSPYRELTAPDPALHRRARRPLRERHRHRRHPRVRRRHRGGASSSTTRARCSSRAGCCSARAPS